MVPEWGDDGFLPPGRYRLDPDSVEKLLVEDPQFESSDSRRRLWDGLESYLSRFFDLEEQHRAVTGDVRLIHAIWLGGSYVSTKLNPQNVDLTVLMDESAVEAMKGLQGTKWLVSAFSRQARLAEFGVSPLRVGYRPIVSVFRADRLNPGEQAYLRERGAWDDWWQRCRPGGMGKTEPTVESASPRRGYLEVTF
ncbi:hypothetical protein SBI_05148 [Streptomyces bingchenggensis BCW-1]|uniref:Uncharacterized protein n=1 Tax=Streptomyces bingchenggensis (strain BCW-1) TaxID=749414 RepID=D7C542_STRBB|nr:MULTISPECIES: hypothetical protein [Streptomyces]ADI08268.1 hypothetical protein SBI_05148 [Streptomyces bingchenggensis BCW-1]